MDLYEPTIAQRSYDWMVEQLAAGSTQWFSVGDIRKGIGAASDGAVAKSVHRLVDRAGRAERRERGGRVQFKPRLRATPQGAVPYQNWPPVARTSPDWWDWMPAT